MEGISFIIRVKNEENVIEQSIRSIICLTIPYDIHVILNTCTDKTGEIVEKLKNEGLPIFIYRYDYQISRAGYETLITDSTSPHSMVEYTRWSINKARYPWIFRWDADFLMTNELRNLLNSRSWKKTEKNTIVRLPAKSEDSVNEESYLFCASYELNKYIFWEYTTFIGETTKLDPCGAYIVHNSTFKNIKPYWLNRPWFMTDDSEEAEILRIKYKIVTDLIGDEPVGSARGSNVENSYYQFKVSDNEQFLKLFDIYLYK